MKNKITAKEYQEMINKPSKKSKFGNVRVETEDGKFDSKREANRYKELKLLEKANEITGISRQVRFNLQGVVYVADFVYFNIKERKWIVEDSKGFKTPEYKNKKTLMLNLLDIEIKES